MTARIARYTAAACALALAAGGCALLESPDARARRAIAESADAVSGVRGYVEWCVDHRLAGRDAEASMPRFLDYAAGASAWRFRHNPDFWAKDVDFSCASPWNDRFRGQRAGTLVSAVHIVFANHYPFTPGTKLVFLGRDGSMHWRSYLSGVRVAGTDLMVGLLDRPLPPSVRPAAILPDGYERYIGDGGGLPVATFDQEEKLIVAELWPIPKAPEALSMMSRNMKFKPSIPEPDGPAAAEAAEKRLKIHAKRAEFYEHLVTGDSGNPCFLIVGNEPVLLYTVFTGGPGSGPALHKLRAPLQAAMDVLSPGYSLREFDFEGLLQ